MAVTQATVETYNSTNLLMWICELCCSNTCFNVVARSDIHVWWFTWKWKTPKAMDFSFSSLAEWKRGSLLQVLSVLRKNIKVWSLKLTLAVVYAGESGPPFACDQWPVYPVMSTLGWSVVACKIVLLFSVVLYAIGVLHKSDLSETPNKWRPVKKGPAVIGTHVFTMISVFSSHSNCRSSALCWVKGCILSMFSLGIMTDLLTHSLVHSWICVPLRAFASFMADAHSSYQLSSVAVS
jgi:hypothetical protein